MMKYFTKEVQIALVAILGIVVLFFGMKFLKGLTVFSSDDNYFVVFSDVSGLAASSPVYANGFRVGVVEDVIYDYDNRNQIVAKVGLNKQLRLPKGSSAEISSDLLGNVKLELVFGPNPVDLLAPGDTISGGKQQGIMGKAEKIIPNLEKMLPKIDSILASVNYLLADPAIASSLHNVDHITSNLITTTSELNRLTASLNKQMPGMMEKADGVLSNTETITKNISELDIAMTLAKVNSTLQNVEELTAKLNSSEGTVGLLLRDPELYRNLTSTMSHTDSLIMDLKAHPMRYVHFSLFGRKER